METKKLSELYKIAINTFPIISKGKAYHVGLCLLTCRMYYERIFEYIDHSRLSRDIQKNRPNKFSILFYNKNFTDSSYWWTCDEAGDAQRIRFLKYQMRKQRILEFFKIK